MDIERAVFDAVKNGVSKADLTDKVLTLVDRLGLDDKIVPIGRAETMAQNIAKDLSQRTLKQGDRVQTSQGEAVAVVLTPEELLRRLSA